MPALVLFHFLTSVPAQPTYDQCEDKREITMEATLEEPPNGVRRPHREQDLCVFQAADLR